MAQKIVKPWLPDDHPNDERLADFFARDENSVEWKLMGAWDDVLDAVAWYQGPVVARLTREADSHRDALAAGWIRHIAARIDALPTKLSTGQGAFSREDLLSAAADRLSSAPDDKQNVVDECAALRQESHKRMDVPLLKLLNEFGQEITHLSVSYPVKAAYFQSVVTSLETLLGPRLADAVTLTSGMTKANANKDAREESDDANLQEWDWERVPEFNGVAGLETLLGPDIADAAIYNDQGTSAVAITATTPSQEPNWIPSQEMALCLSRMAGWNTAKWKRALEGSRKWLTVPTFYQRGMRGGRSNSYQPVLLMSAILDHAKHVAVRQATMVFSVSPPLKPWRDQWDRHIENLATAYENRTQA